MCGTQVIAASRLHFLWFREVVNAGYLAESFCSAKLVALYPVSTYTLLPPVIDTPLDGTQDDHARIQVRIRRTAGAMFTVPIYLDPRLNHNALDLPRACFGVWDEFTPAVQVGGRKRLMVEELIPDDTLSVEFINTNNDYFTLEFFHLEVYYTLKPLTLATSGDL